MNSNRLKSKYTKVYSDFFNNYDIVISSPITFVFVGDSSYHNNGNTSIISQKITLRNYIGYNHNHKSNKIKYKYYNGKDFVESRIENHYHVNKEILNKVGLDGEIGILSEMAWNDPPSVLSNILLLKMYLEKEISLDVFSLLRVCEEKSKKIMKKVCELDKELLQKYNLFGGLRNTQIFLPGTILKSNSHILTMEKENQISWKNMGNEANYFSLNLSISILSPNVDVVNKYNTKTLKERKERLLNFMKKEDITIKNQNDISLVDAIEKINNFCAINIYQNLKRLYENNQTGEYFFDDLKTYRSTIKALFENNHEGLNRKYIKQQIKDEINIKNFNFYMDNIGITCLSKFFLVSKKTGDIDENIISKINEKTGYNLKLDYSSYYDGFEIDGTLLEQDKENNIISEFVSDYKIIKHYNNQCKVSYGDYEELLIEYNDKLIINSIENKMYLGTNKLTSKTICSQSSLTSILLLFLEKGKKQIKSTSLPISSYSRSKTEMQNKIILPFIKFVKKEFDKNIQYELIGSNSDFILDLDLGQLEIYVICES